MFGGEPFASRDLRQAACLQRVAAVVLQALVGAVQQTRRHGEAMVRATEPLEDDGLEHVRQAPAAIGRIGCQRRPASLLEAAVSLREARRCGDLALFEAAPDLVADAVDRLLIVRRVCRASGILSVLVWSRQ